MPIPYKKLKNLAEVQKLQDSDITVIEDQDTTRKGTLKQLIQYVKEHNDISSFYAHQEDIGAANGIAPLDDQARLPSEFLSYGKETGTVYEGSAGKALEASLDSHKADSGNPHKTTKAQVGLGNVTNESKATMFNSPVFTGIPTAPTADADDNSGQLANTEFVNRQIANGIAASDAMIFKGTLGTGGTISALPSTYLTGWTYRVVTDGTYAGQPCETGDLIVALTDRKGSGNLDSDWTVCQTNIDGAVIQTRKINAGSGLTGGGTLAADRTLNVGAGNGIHVDADSISVKSNTTGSPGAIGKTVTNADGVGVVLGTDSSSAFRGDQGKAAYDHSLAAHARTDATKTERSEKNGNIKINGTETPVYKLPDTATFGDGAGFSIDQTAGTYQQKIEVVDNSTAGDAVFRVSQSEDSGTTFHSLLEVRDDATGYLGSGKIYTTNNKPGKADVGLGNVPNVTTNNQTPTFTSAAALAGLTSGETLSVSLGKTAKSISDYITHQSDNNKHVTTTEKSNWNDANAKKHVHGNQSILDTLTQPLLDKWNTVSDKVDKVTGKGLSSNDFSTALLNKLNGIADGAEVNVQADWNITDSASDAFIKNKPASFPPSSHTHTKAQISDMPTKLSQFTNDPGYLTSADIDTSQNHTHVNKGILDTLTQAMLDKWNTVSNKVDKVSGKGLSTNDFTAALLSKLNGIAEGANKYTHPASHPASMITEDSTHRFLTDFCKTITDWNSAAANGFYMGNDAANAPSTGWYFGRVTAHNANYLYQEVYQFTASADARAVPKYIRVKSNGAWGSWSNVTVAAAVPSNAKFTDTVYTHPNSGASAGTYKSVTVNAQGHVTGGTNPTTLSGYGITDAAAKSHTHNYAGSASAGGAASSAEKLSASRTISLTGDITGSASTNLSGNVSIATSLAGGVLKEKISATEPTGLSVNNYWLQEY